MDRGYQLLMWYYDAEWDEKFKELGSGRIYEQGERLYEGWVQKAGPRTIRIVLKDLTGKREDKVHEF